MPEYCVTLSQFPAPQNSYETIFGATIAKQFGSNLNSLVYPYIASFSSKDILAHSISTIPLNLLQLFESNYAIMSHYNYGMILAIDSAIYRSCQLAATAITHRIELTNWHPATKFCSSSFVTLLPLAVIYLLGFSSTEIVVASTLKIVASAILPVRHSNKVKELDLISTYRQFNLKNFIGQNALMGVRNFAATAFMDGTAFFSLGISPFTPYPPEFGVCIPDSTNDLEFYAHGYVNTPLTYLFDELAWMIGKIAVDVIFLLLAYASVVKDLRDPINSIWHRPKTYRFPKTPSRFNTLTQRTTNSSVSVRHSAATGEYENSMVDFVESTAESYKAPAPPKEKRRHKTDQNVAQASSSNAIAETADVVERKALPIPNYARKLEPLSHAIEGISKNVWGVVIYGNLQVEEEQIKDHMRSLGSGHIGLPGSSSAIKLLRKVENTPRKVYEVRPKNRGPRILGTEVRGEEAVYNLLKDYFGYERAIALTRQMREADGSGDMSLISFSYYTDHEDINKNIDRL